jgi:chromosome segregation ATPase
MGLFNRRSPWVELEKIHHRLTHSFANVKDDIHALKYNTQNYHQWIHYLNNKIQRQERQISSLLKHIRNMPTSHQEVREIVREHDRYDLVLAKVEDVNRKLASIADSHHPVVRRLNEHHVRLSTLETRQKIRRPSFKEKMVQKITKNSKEYIKGLMLSLVTKYERISGLQLREIIVEEQGLCSKSTFYRLLTELERSDDMEVIQDGKEKYYVNRLYPRRRN